MQSSWTSLERWPRCSRIGHRLHREPGAEQAGGRQPPAALLWSGPDLADQLLEARVALEAAQIRILPEQPGIDAAVEGIPGVTDLIVEPQVLVETVEKRLHQTQRQAKLDKGMADEAAATGSRD